MTSLAKTMENSDLRETKQNIYRLKGQCLWELSKMCFLLNLGYCVKRYGHFGEIMALLFCPLTKYGHVPWPKMQILKIFIFVLILHLILGKVTKFLVERLSTSEIKKCQGGHPPSAFRVKREGKLYEFNQITLLKRGKTVWIQPNYTALSW